MVRMVHIRGEMGWDTVETGWGARRGIYDRGWWVRDGVPAKEGSLRERVPVRGGTFKVSVSPDFDETKKDGGYGKQ